MHSAWKCSAFRCSAWKGSQLWTDYFGMPERGWSPSWQRSLWSFRVYSRFMRVRRERKAKHPPPAIRFRRRPDSTRWTILTGSRSTPCEVFSRSSPAMILISNKQIKNAHNKKDLLSKGSFFISTFFDETNSFSLSL